MGKGNVTEWVALFYAIKAVSRLINVEYFGPDILWLRFEKDGSHDTGK